MNQEGRRMRRRIRRRMRMRMKMMKTISLQRLREKKIDEQLRMEMRVKLTVQWSGPSFSLLPSDVTVDLPSPSGGFCLCRFFHRFLIGHHGTISHPHPSCLFSTFPSPNSLSFISPSTFSFFLTFIMSTRVYLGHLPRDASDREVEGLFKNYGRLREVTLKNGFGFVEFSDAKDADDAVHDLHGKDFMGER